MTQDERTRIAADVANNICEKLEPIVWRELELASAVLGTAGLLEVYARVAVSVMAGAITLALSATDGRDDERLAAALLASFAKDVAATIPELVERVRQHRASTREARP